MKATKTILFSLGFAALLTACGHDQKNENPVGNWTSAAPVSVTASIANASTAQKSLSFDFTAPAAEANGTFTMTADYDVTPAAAANDSVQTYQVKATINGTWTQDTDDQDDFLLTFDKNTLSVNGTNAPELGPVTDDFLNSLAQFTTIEDVEVSKDGQHMTFETKNPEVKYHFVKK